jgi:peptidoglycan-N-acetylglucosamine deacetylase
MRRIAAVVGIAAIAVGAFLAAGRLADRSRAASLSLTLMSRTVHVRPGTTLAELVSHYNLRPRRGDIFDVNGRLLERGVVPGQILVDGRLLSPTSRLDAGEKITVVPGRSRREPLARQIEHLRGRIPADPEFDVAYARGEEVIIRGALSHELVSARFYPQGPIRVRKVVALTFDDGPWPSSTPAILDTLQRLHVRATFFVIGYLAHQYPGLVRRELRLGMTIGNHTYNHPQVPPFDQLPLPLLRDEIGLDQQILEKLGVRTHLFRPPGGSTSSRVVRAAAATGERVVLWSVDPTDWQPGVTAAQITHRVLSAIRAGSIVILHDGGGDRSATLAALPAIVHGIRARGLRLVPLSPAEQ